MVHLIPDNELTEVSKRDWKLIRRAAEVAFNSIHDFRHGAILAKGRKEIRSAFNVARPVASFRRFHPHASLHAEIGVLLNIDKEKTHSADIYVSRLDAYDKLTFSRPCQMCQSVAMEMGIDRIYYSINENHVGVIKLYKD